MPKKVSAAELEKHFPEQMNALRKKLVKESLPKLPSSIREEMQIKGQTLLDGESHDLPPTIERPFIAHCRIAWQEDNHAQFVAIDRVLPRKGATIRETNLIKWLNNSPHLQCIYDETSDEVYDSEFMREFNRRITDFLDEGQALEGEFDFDFDDWFNDTLEC